jgi:MFS family permease
LPLTPFKVRNVRLFIAFRIFFNARFYYPVFTILFLDFGLSMAQFALLNAIWAATIVLVEVPSGALADILGRKRLLAGAGVLMVGEIALLCFAPRGNPTLLFAIFSVNRILSGLAEAAASGADEALAYDSLAEKGIKDQWGRVLEVLMRFQSLGFIIAMTLGAAVYDHTLVEAVCRFSGIEITLTKEITLRFPLYLTFLLACGALITTLKMKDPGGKASSPGLDLSQVRKAFSLTLRAGLWISKTPFALSVILFGMLFDGLIRMVITLASQYYRMIHLPESGFGLIGSFVALLGLVIPRLAKTITDKHSPSFALWVTAFMTFAGLAGMSFFWPYYGLIPALMTFSAMYFTGFFVSFYINQLAASDQRATVLSFKGLAYNISYGVLGVLYALVLKTQKHGIPGPDLENQVFVQTFAWFPAAFALWFCLLVLVYIFRLRKK